MMRQSGVLALVLFVNFAAASSESNQDGESSLYRLQKRIPISQQAVYIADDGTLASILGSNFNNHKRNHLSLSAVANDKRAIPMSGGIYGKRSTMNRMPEASEEEEDGEAVMTFKRALPFSGGIYGKRAYKVPFSGGVYGKRSIALRSIPISGGIYG